MTRNLGSGTPQGGVILEQNGCEVIAYATNFPSTEIKRDETETPTGGTLSKTHLGWETVLETEYY